MKLLSIIIFFTFLPVLIFRSCYVSSQSTNTFLSFCSTKLSANILFQHFHLRKFTYAPLSIPKLCTASQFGILLLLAGDVSLNPGPKNNVNFGFTNIRSIRNKYAPLHHYILTENLHIVGLSETWLSSTDSPSFISEITPATHILHSLPRVGKRGGGVGFYVHKDLQSSVMHTKKYQSFEHIVVSIKLRDNFYNFVSLYKPPNIKFVTFMDDFTDLLEHISSLSAPFIISGDFNLQIDISSSTTDYFSSTLNSFNLTQHIDFKTHLHGHILDLLITPSNLDLLCNFRSSDCFSDHMFVRADLDIPMKYNHLQRDITYRRFHKINMSLLKKDLLSSDFIINPSTDVNELYDQYHNTLSSLLDKHAPAITKKIDKPTPKWFCDDINKARREKRQAERLWRKLKTPFTRSHFEIFVTTLYLPPNVDTIQKQLIMQKIIQKNCGLS